MTEFKFKTEMRRAQLMINSNGDYWRGYQRGLRRAYHGERFGTLDEHAMYLSLKNSDYDSKKQTGLGYRAGLTVQ